MLESDPQIIDGFTYSMNLPYLPINYRSAALAQMETLRLTGNYQMKMFAAPSPTGNNPGGTAIIGNIPAFGQIEQQLSVDPGSYIYGVLCSASIFHVRITDACTETSLSSDYIQSSLIFQAISAPATLAAQRGPCLLAQPRLISEPGLVNIEIYNGASSSQPGQVVLFCATPRPNPPPNSFSGNPGWHPGRQTRGGPQY
jgi:hypothetical protein